MIKVKYFSLSSIEKGNLIEMIKNKSIVSNNGLDGGPFNLVNTKDSPNIYYDKRLIRICQVPQMPYLEKDIVTGIWKSTKETVEAVKKGTLFIEKDGQKYVMNDSNLNQKDSNKLHISSTDILTQKINGSDVSVHLSKEEMQKILDEGKKTQKLILQEEDEFEPKYVDYEIDCSGMGILSVSIFIEEIEKRNDDTILTVNCSDGSAYHTYFDKKRLEDLRESVNSRGAAITKVWVTEEFNKTKNEKAFYEKREEYWENKYKNENVQYMKSENGEVYGFTFDGEIYIDEDLVNSNVLAHEYTHVWDNYVQKNNPDLWDKEIVALKNTSLWQEVVNDKNYAELTTDSEILSECHARIVGKMAEKVLNRIAEIDGELTKDKIIDWDKEVSEYIATELLIRPKLGDENYTSESIKTEYLKEFLAMPMKDLMNEVKLHFEQENQIEKEKNIESTIIQDNTESVATNFLLEKLNKAGIETISDKEIYENMLAYVKEVNICLEMLEAEQYPVQMMGEKEKGSSLGAHLGNQQSSGRTLYHKYNISEQERQDMLNDFESNFDISLFSNDVTVFMQQIKERFKLGVENTEYAHIKIANQKYTIRISDHGVSTNIVRKNEIESSLVFQLPETKNKRFRDQNQKAVKEFIYKGETLTEERKKDILDGLHNYLKTGKFTGNLADDVRNTTAYELQQNLAQQMTLSGIKKGLMTGVALATMFCNMPKLAAETGLLNRDTYQETQIVQLENNIEIINFNDGSKAICNKDN